MVAVMLAVTCLPLALTFNAPLIGGASTIASKLRVSAIRAAEGAAPTLREQMQAYIKSVQERGVELTPDQKAMIAEFEADDELLDQSGRVDFLKGATVMTQEEFQAEQAATEVTAAPAAAAPAPATFVQVPAPAPALATPDDALDPAVVRLWLMQQGDRDKATQLLGKRVVSGALSDAESGELRRALSSLVVTLSS